MTEGGVTCGSHLLFHSSCLMERMAFFSNRLLLYAVHWADFT